MVKLHAILALPAGGRSHRKFFVHTLRHFSESVLEPDWHELCSVIYTFRRSDAKFACKFSDVGKRFLFSQFFDLRLFRFPGCDAPALGMGFYVTRFTLVDGSLGSEVRLDLFELPVARVAQVDILRSPGCESLLSVRSRELEGESSELWRVVQDFKLFANLDSTSLDLGLCRGKKLQ